MLVLVANDQHSVMLLTWPRGHLIGTLIRSDC